MAVTVTEVTAECPPPLVEIDRSFATPTPACLAGLSAITFEQTTWGELVIQSGEEIARQQICLREVRAWIEAEQIARGYDDEQ